MEVRKMNIWNQIFRVLAGIMWAWCAVWFASETSNWVATLAGNERVRVLLLLGIITSFVTLLGIILFVMFLAILLDKERRFDKVEDTLPLSLLATCASFLFGVIVAPIGEDGGQWLSPWDVLLILGFLPMALFVKNIFADIFSLRRKKALLKAGK
jgi:hypothetical protein